MQTITEIDGKICLCISMTLDDEPTAIHSHFPLARNHHGQYDDLIGKTGLDLMTEASGIVAVRAFRGNWLRFDPGHNVAHWTESEPLTPPKTKKEQWYCAGIWRRRLAREIREIHPSMKPTIKGASQ